jgi:hypothetical protein
MNWGQSKSRTAEYSERLPFRQVVYGFESLSRAFYKRELRTYYFADCLSLTAEAVEKDRRMREIAFGAIFSLVVALAAFLTAAWPIPGRPVASYFPPTTPASHIILAISQAGGHLLDIGAGPTLVISLGNGSGYAADLYKSGAWFVVDASFARLCIKPWRTAP